MDTTQSLSVILSVCAGGLGGLVGGVISAWIISSLVSYKIAVMLKDALVQLEADDRNLFRHRG